MPSCAHRRSPAAKAALLRGQSGSISPPSAAFAFVLRDIVSIVCFQSSGMFRVLHQHTDSHMPFVKPPRSGTENSKPQVPGSVWVKVPSSLLFYHKSLAAQSAESSAASRNLPCGSSPRQCPSSSSFQRPADTAKSQSASRVSELYRSATVHAAPKMPFWIASTPSTTFLRPSSARDAAHSPSLLPRLCQNSVRLLPDARNNAPFCSAFPVPASSPRRTKPDRLSSVSSLATFQFNCAQPSEPMPMMSALWFVLRKTSAFSSGAA